MKDKEKTSVNIKNSCLLLQKKISSTANIEPMMQFQYLTNICFITFS